MPHHDNPQQSNKSIHSIMETTILWQWAARTKSTPRIRYAMWRADSGGNRPGTPAALAGDNPAAMQFEAITLHPCSRRVQTSPSHSLSLSLHPRTRELEAHRSAKSACHTHGEHQHGVGHLAVHAGRRRASDDGQWPCQLRVGAKQQAGKEAARGTGRGGGRRPRRARGGRGRGHQDRGEAAADRAQEGRQGIYVIMCVQSSSTNSVMESVA